MTVSQKYYNKAYSGNAAENYERYFVPMIGAPLAKDLVDVAALRPGERVLDVACGTGVVARLASERVGSTGTVAGLDINPAMLAVASSATPSDVSIQWHEASAEAMPLPDAGFDVVLCQMGLQFVPDRGAALREMRRVLAPAGRLILNVPGPTPPALAMMAEALADQIGAEAARFVNHVFSLHDSQEIEDLLGSARFRDVSVKAETRRRRLPRPEEFLWYYVHSTPLAGALEHVDDERKASLERDFVERCGDLVEDGGLILEVRIVVATARK
jgi:ubiquinone/menaquinone biosynthesis C-methylase UbiE